MVVNDNGCVECGEMLLLQFLVNDLFGDILLDFFIFWIEFLFIGGVVIWDLQMGILFYIFNDGFIGIDVFIYSISNVFGE